MGLAYQKFWWDSVPDLQQGGEHYADCSVSTLVTCSSEQIAIWSLSGFTTTSRCLPTATVSGWRTSYVSPPDSCTVNGSKGRRETNCRMTSEFIMAQLHPSGRQPHHYSSRASSGFYCRYR